MSVSKKLGKRSIIGSRVCAPQTDGLLYAGTIVSVNPPTSTSTSAAVLTFNVQFDINGLIQTFREHDLVGAGFQLLTAARLKPQQTVYITRNGREVKGHVVSRCQQQDDDVMWVDGDVTCGWDEVWVSVYEEQRPHRIKVEDIRLMESRKSARLQQDIDTQQQQQQQQYNNDMMSSLPLRSSVIDVPVNLSKHRRDYDNEMMMYDNDVPMYSNNDESCKMDEHMAALVLTSLSCSPVTPPFHKLQPNTAGVGSSKHSSGLGTSLSPSPPKCQLSHSAPAVSGFSLMNCDDSSDVQSLKRTVFKCTWPGCGRVYTTCQTVEKHVRNEHLGPRDDSSVDMSDHEEEFYYTEIEENIDTVADIFPDMNSKSLIRTSFTHTNKPTPSDHDYLRKEFQSVPLTIPKSSHPQQQEQEQQLLWRQQEDTRTHVPQDNCLSMSLPSSDVFSFMTAPVNEHVPGVLPLPSSYDYHDMSHVSSVSKPHRKSRGDVKKCRKVYGIENRAMWCTQCKWKKACNRFSNEHSRTADID